MSRSRGFSMRFAAWPILGLAIGFAPCAGQSEVSVVVSQDVFEKRFRGHAFGHWKDFVVAAGEQNNPGGEARLKAGFTLLFAAIATVTVGTVIGYVISSEVATPYTAWVVVFILLAYAGAVFVYCFLTYEDPAQRVVTNLLFGLVPWTVSCACYLLAMIFVDLKRQFREPLPQTETEANQRTNDNLNWITGGRPSRITESAEELQLDMRVSLLLAVLPSLAISLFFTATFATGFTGVGTFFDVLALCLFVDVWRLVLHSSLLLAPMWTLTGRRSSGGAYPPREQVIRGDDGPETSSKELTLCPSFLAMSNGANSAKPAVDMMAGMERQERILVIDFGSQVSHLICRRVREAGVYCELRSCLLKLEDVKNFNPNGVILSGGPHSVYDKDAPHLCKDIWGYIDEKKLPVFGICYGLQEMCHSLGGKVEAGVKREFGHADLLIREDVAVQSQNGAKKSKGRSPIFEGIDGHKVPVWMSHGDKVTQIPPGFVSIAYTSNTEYAAIEDQVRHFYGVQYHPEVTHTPNGATMIKNFVLKVVGCKGEWNMHDFCQKQIDIIMNKLHGKYVVGAVSGGVDSSVAAALVHKAIGDRFRPFMVDTGLLRKDESTIVKERLESHIPGMKLKVLDATADFYKELAGVTEPEKKRKIIGRLFVEAFEKAVSEMGLPHENCLLLQGTLYPDVIESTSYKGPSSIIKTHHNVGGLPDRMKMEVIEPLRLLFKDEVRALGRELGLPVTSVMRHPFPGPGLGIRIIGEINKETADRLSHADDIYIEELRKTGHYDKIGQAFAVLLPTVRSVGVMGDHRTYENVCVLRAVTTTDFMTADWYDMPHDVLARISNRIINEVKGINRVCYDASSDTRPLPGAVMLTFLLCLVWYVVLILMKHHEVGLVGLNDPIKIHVLACLTSYVFFPTCLALSLYYNETFFRKHLELPTEATTAIWLLMVWISAAFMLLAATIFNATEPNSIGIVGMVFSILYAAVKFTTNVPECIGMMTCSTAVTFALVFASVQYADSIREALA
eukprot:s2970_g2.t1